MIDYSNVSLKFFTRSVIHYSAKYQSTKVKKIIVSFLCAVKTI